MHCFHHLTWSSTCQLEDKVPKFDNLPRQLGDLGWSLVVRWMDSANHAESAEFFPVEPTKTRSIRRPSCPKGEGPSELGDESRVSPKVLKLQLQDSENWTLVVPPPPTRHLCTLVLPLLMNSLRINTFTFFLLFLFRIKHHFGTFLLLKDLSFIQEHYEKNEDPK